MWGYAIIVLVILYFIYYKSEHLVGTDQEVRCDPRVDCSKYGLRWWNARVALPNGQYTCRCAPPSQDYYGRVTPKQKSVDQTQIAPGYKKVGGKLVRVQ